MTLKTRIMGNNTSSCGNRFLVLFFTIFLTLWEMSV